MTKRDAILQRLAGLSDEDLEKLVTPPATTTTTETPAVPSVPVTTPAPAPNPGTPNAPATPSTPPTPTAPATPATAADPATLAAAATAILSASGIDIASLNAMLAGEKARQDQQREILITALSSRVPDLTREILGSQSMGQLEMMARAAGILGGATAATLGLPVDYSGMGLPVQPAALSTGDKKKYTPPDPFKLKAKAEGAAN